VPRFAAGYAGSRRGSHAKFASGGGGLRRQWKSACGYGETPERASALRVSHQRASTGAQPALSKVEGRKFALGVGPHRQWKRVGSLLLICALLSVAQLWAQDARAIVAEAQRRTASKSQHYEGLLQVFDSKGTIADKRWTLDRIGSHGNSKTILRFTVPAEVKGVALLVVNHPNRASDQWMWTPGIERDRRIALQDRSQRFFGTDFSFEDMEERDVDQFDYTLAGEEDVEGVACWKIESVPKHRQLRQE
jgi:outer membrane lipoprotein-sorting protein